MKSWNKFIFDISLGFELRMLRSVLDRKYHLLRFSNRFSGEIPFGKKVWLSKAISVNFTARRLYYSNKESISKSINIELDFQI